MHGQVSGPQIEHFTARLVSIDRFAVVCSWALISQLVAQRPIERLLKARINRRANNREINVAIPAKPRNLSRSLAATRWENLTSRIPIGCICEAAQEKKETEKQSSDRRRQGMPGWVES